MSGSDLTLKLTADQRELLSKFLVHRVDQIKITRSTAKNMVYGMAAPTQKPKGARILVLTKDQKKLLKDKFNCTCTYLEVTSRMEIK